MTESNSSASNCPIDVVIAWVDGNDPLLAAKRRSYLKGDSASISSGAHSTRFASANEIKYCVLSILRFAPFVRNIFIVTDGQDPGLYGDIQTYFPERLNSVKIVDHTEIFEGYENFLPTFNSISIASMIWRIRGLSDNFIYFNDDTFLIRRVQPEEWFISNKPVIRGKWVPAPLLRVLYGHLRIYLNKHAFGNLEFQPRASFHMGQWNSASLLGFKFRYFTNSHTPHTVNRKIIESFFDKRSDLLKKNISYRFRDYSQFTFISLSNHLQLLDGNRLVARPDLAYLKPFNRPESYIDKKISFCENNPAIKFMCVQSLDMCSKEDQEKLFGWLEKILQLS
jgi:hypothetical protein